MHCTVTVDILVTKDIVKYSLVKATVLPFMLKLVLRQPVCILCAYVPVPPFKDRNYGRVRHPSVVQAMGVGSTTVLYTCPGSGGQRCIGLHERVGSVPSRKTACFN